MQFTKKLFGAMMALTDIFRKKPRRRVSHYPTPAWISDPHQRTRNRYSTREPRTTTKCGGKKHKWRFRSRLWSINTAAPAGFENQARFQCARCGDTITAHIKNKHGDKINFRRSDRAKHPELNFFPNINPVNS